jgi:hypothetical protein
VVYFIRDGKHVKIGYTQDSERLAARLGALQAGNPRELVLVALMKHGGPRTERALHDAFRPWWIGGGWFELEGPVARTLTFVRTSAMPAEVVAYATKTAARSQAFRRKTHGAERKVRQHGRRQRTDLTCEL